MITAWQYKKCGMNAKKSRIKNREASTHLRRDDDNFKDLIVLSEVRCFRVLVAKCPLVWSTWKAIQPAHESLQFDRSPGRMGGLRSCLAYKTKYVMICELSYCTSLPSRFNKFQLHIDMHVFRSFYYIFYASFYISDKSRNPRKRT